MPEPRTTTSEVSLSDKNFLASCYAGSMQLIEILERIEAIILGCILTFVQLWSSDRLGHQQGARRQKKRQHDFAERSFVEAAEQF